MELSCPLPGLRTWLTSVYQVYIARLPELERAVQYSALDTVVDSVNEGKPQWPRQYQMESGTRVFWSWLCLKLRRFFLVNRVPKCLKHRPRLLWSASGWQAAGSNKLICRK